MPLLQDSMDAFVRAARKNSDSDVARLSEWTMDAMQDYLIRFSDLYQETQHEGDIDLEDWELALSASMEELIGEDDLESLDLGNLELGDLDFGQLREFMGWYLPRHPEIQTGVVDQVVHAVKSWVEYTIRKGWLDGENTRMAPFLVGEMGKEVVRVTKVAELMLSDARSGILIRPRAEGSEFDQFREGHARVVQTNADHIELDFGKSEYVSPVRVSEGVGKLLQPGDLLDVEIGHSGEEWLVLDMGPVYPGFIYMEEEEFDQLAA